MGLLDKKAIWMLTIAIVIGALLLVWYSLRTENQYLVRPPTQQTTPMPENLIRPGVHPLGLGGWRWVNRGPLWRDGVLVIPHSVAINKPKPLLIWLHHGGGNARQFEHLHPLAERFGLIILLLDARHNTWDGIDSPFGPDVEFINHSLDHLFTRTVIDQSKIALAGLSDGGSYALALGRANGIFFTHIMAVAPWLLSPPGPRVGKPNLYIAHGRQDNIYPVGFSKSVIVPLLQKQGYQVKFRPFDGPHWIPVDIAEEMLRWFMKTP